MIHLRSFWVGWQLFNAMDVNGGWLRSLFLYPWLQGGVKLMFSWLFLGLILEVRHWYM